MTEWRAVVGFEGRYEVSDDGQVKVLAGPGRGRFNTDRLVKIHKDSPGYPRVILYPGGGRRGLAKRVHILMLEAFIGPKPDGALGLHVDDDRNNNRISNLHWGTKSDNSFDMVRNGNHNNARKTHCKWGHPLSGANLIATPRQRACRECARRRNAEYTAKRRSLAVYAADTLAGEAA